MQSFGVDVSVGQGIVQVLKHIHGKNIQMECSMHVNCPKINKNYKLEAQGPLPLGLPCAITPPATLSAP